MVLTPPTTPLGADLRHITIHHNTAVHLSAQFWKLCSDEEKRWKHTIRVFLCILTFKKMFQNNNMQRQGFDRKAFLGGRAAFEAEIILLAQLVRRSQV